jgi:hypothetical protein
MRVHCSSEIAQPPDAVFPWIADPEKAVQWQKNVQGGKILIRKPEIVGTTFTEVIEEDGNTLELQGIITKYVENTEIDFHLQSRIHELDVRYALEAIWNGTKLSITAIIHWKFPMNIISLLMGKKMEAGLREQLHREILELIRLCEGG